MAMARRKFKIHLPCGRGVVGEHAGAERSVVRATIYASSAVTRASIAAVRCSNEVVAALD